MRTGRDIDRMRFVAGSAAEHAEVDELGRFFAESFQRMVKELDAYLNDR